MRFFIRILILTLCFGTVYPVAAEELIGTPSGQPVAISTNTVNGTPVAVSTTTAVIPVAIATAPAAGLPVAIATGPITAPGVAVAVPVDANRDYGVVAWKKLEGTVQSVDRSNRTMLVQDPEGKNVSVAWNNRIHIYRRGEEVNYSDVAPNDDVVLRYEPER